MDSDERDIFYYLKSWGKEYVSAREVCRRAGAKKRFQENADWAKPVLVRMLERGILESDSLSRYRVKPMPKKSAAQRWVSPEISKILREGGVEVADGSHRIDEDEHYDQL